MLRLILALMICYIFYVVYVTDYIDDEMKK